MGIVKDKLLDSGTRPAVIIDCVQLVDNEVASKKGVTGMMIKGGYKAFKAIKPTIVKEAVDILLDSFIEIADGHYGEYMEDEPEKKNSFESWVSSRSARIADDLLGVTDDIMNRSNKAALKKIYKGMRGIAQKNVAVAVPAVGRLVEKHVA